MSGPENRFIAAVHRRLSPTVYREKMNNPYRGGTFDVWYSGKLGDMWIEYKWVPRLPKARLVPELSELQKKWGRGRYKEGRRLRVVVGSPTGAVVFNTPDQWEEGIESSKWTLLSKEEIAIYIALLTAGKEEEKDGATSNVGGRRQRKHVRVPDRDHRVSTV